LESQIQDNRTTRNRQNSNRSMRKTI